MEINIKNKSGNSTKNLTLDPSVWNLELNEDLLHQSIYVYLANQRQWTKSTKTRSNVKYANQKLRPQKGSGRARVGSRRSPLMVGGGVAHGPLPKNIRKSLNKKMKIKALKIALSAKFNDKELNVIDQSPIKDNPSTKIINDYIKSLDLKGSILFVTPDNDKVLIKSCENINNVEVIEASSLNAYALIRPKNLVISVDAVEKIHDLWGEPDFKTVSKSAAPAKKATSAKKTTKAKTTKAKTTAKKKVVIKDD